MRSILAAGAALILRVSRILRGTGTLTHYRGLRDDGMPGHRGRGSRDVTGTRVIGGHPATRPRQNVISQ
jgi:hypothetical protein